MSRLLHESFEATGSPQTVYPEGIPSAEAFGTPVIAGPVSFTGIPSAEAFGSPTVGLGVAPSGIASAEAFGTFQVSSSVLIDGIPSAEAFGSPTVGLQVEPEGIPSAEAFGTPVVSTVVSVDGIPSEEAFGSPTVGIGLSLDGIPSGEAFGTPVIAGPVTLVGIPSAEAFGTPIISGPIVLSGIPSAEAFGTFVVASIEVSTTQIDASGGTQVQIRAYGLADGYFKVYLGPLGSAQDAVCYAASPISGRPLYFVPLVGGKIDVITPLLPVGGPYAFYLSRLTGTGAASFTSPFVITAYEPSTRGRVTSLRRIFPPKMRVKS